jgi:hypothetical protein
MADTSDYAEVLLSEDKEGLYSEPMAAKAWAVDRSSVILGPRVGEGQFGDVHKGTMVRVPWPKTHLCLIMVWIINININLVK